MLRCLACACSLFVAQSALAEISPTSALLYLDPSSGSLGGLRLGGKVAPTKTKLGRAIEFRGPLDRAELAFDKRLDKLTELSIGGWFFTRRQGEQYLFSRGMPEIHADATRRFPPAEGWVNFVLGTDQRGFLLGTIDGNAAMPFPYVTVNEIAIDAWHQLVVVKDTGGGHHFYHNGVRVHSSEHGREGAKTSDHGRPFVDTEPGEPLRLHMPHGGLVGEAWVFGRALTAEEIHHDFAAKRSRYHPAHAGRPVELREMNAHPVAGIRLSPKNWPAERRRIERGARQVLGDFPASKVALEPTVDGEDVDCGSYLRRKMSFQVQPGDRMPCWLLVPKPIAGNHRNRAPAVICFYGTTSGAGKDVTVGLSGRERGTPPVPNLAFAVDMAEAGFVAIAPDYLRDGERIKPGRRPYDTTDFYKQFPDWSIHGKDIWDTMCAVDYLQSLDFVDGEKIGMVGHSYGGHSTIFAAALEPRIKVAVANGPVSDFLHHGLHWAVPKGGGASQSLPALRPYVLDPTRPLPVTFDEFTSLIAPKPLLVGQAAGEYRPMEEENYAAVRAVYAALGHAERVRYHWYAGDHDFPPPARRAAVEWFKRWLIEPAQP